jgi:thimet oligopeptidase
MVVSESVRTGWATFPAPAETENYRTAGLRELDRTRQQLDELLDGDSPRTVAQFLVPLDRILLAVRNLDGDASLLFHAHTDENIRAAGRELSEAASRFVSAFHLNTCAFERLKSIDLTTADAATRFGVEKMLREMQRAGVGQDDAGRDHLLAIASDIDRLHNEFLGNIASWRRSITVSGTNDLEGLPQEFLAAHPARADGSIEVSTDGGDVWPVLEYCESAEVRRRLHRERSNRGYPENARVLRELLSKRYELARALGFPDFATFETETRMLRTPEAVAELLGRICPLLRPTAEGELVRLLERKRKDVPGALRVEEWDDAFYSRKVREESYRIDEARVRSYLPYGTVRDGLLRLCSDLFGLEIRSAPSAHVWHPSVEAYEVRREGVLIGRFYLDSVSRGGKFRGGGCLPIRPGIKGVQTPEAVLLMPLVDSGPSRDAATLPHGKLIGFFHEFGHLLHHILAEDVRWLYDTLGHLESDFMEGPSILFEEWASDPAVLRRFARDPATGEPIPDDLLRRLSDAAAFGRADRWMRQVALSEASLRLHSSDPASFDPGIVLQEAFRTVFTRPLDADSHPETGWQHLASYGACYYTYVWSCVVARDLLAPFRERGSLTDPALAQRYAAEILCPGASRPAGASIRAYLGRDVAEEAFASWVRG